MDEFVEGLRPGFRVEDCREPLIRFGDNATLAVHKDLVLSEGKQSSWGGASTEKTGYTSMEFENTESCLETGHCCFTKEQMVDFRAG